MSKIIIKVDLEDVETTLIGQNIELVINKQFSIVFTPEALDELINDYGNLKKYKKKE